MKIKKGTRLLMTHSQRGTFLCYAFRNFDTEKSKWYPVKAAEAVDGLFPNWVQDDEIFCKRKLCTVQVLDEEN